MSLSLLLTHMLQLLLMKLQLSCLKLCLLPGVHCVQKGMQDFEQAIPWTSFFHGFQDPLPQNVAGNEFTLDLFLLRRQVVDVYKVRAQLSSALMQESRLPVSLLACTICFVAVHCIAYVSTINKWNRVLFQRHVLGCIYVHCFDDMPTV